MADLFYLYVLPSSDPSDNSYGDQASAEVAASDLLGRVREVSAVAVVQLVSLIEAQPVQVTIKTAADVVSEITLGKGVSDPAVAVV